MTNEEIQTALNQLGYGPLTVDGDIGPRSIAAIKGFQAHESLTVDGVAGPKTQAALLVATGARPVDDTSLTPVATMHNKFSAAGMKMLGQSEGIKTKAYYDTKRIVTIGIGATWGSKIFREWWEKNRPHTPFTINSTMSLEEINAVTQLMIDNEYGKAVDDALGKVVPQHVFDACVHACYNMGVGSVKPGSAWRWFVAAKMGDYKGAAHLLRTAYNKPPELFGRRQKEGNLMEFGRYA